MGDADHRNRPFLQTLAEKVDRAVFRDDIMDVAARHHDNAIQGGEDVGADPIRCFFGGKDHQDRFAAR